MFSTLGESLNETLSKVRGQARLSDENIAAAAADVRRALLQADVALAVVEDFTRCLQEQAAGQRTTPGLTPGQSFIKLVEEELVRVLGAQQAELDLATPPPGVILLAGLQGVGKTTTAAKLARYLHETQKKSVLLVSTDTRRPAAMEQLQRLAEQIGIDCHPADHSAAPQTIAEQALTAARRAAKDVLIVDTAGRLAVDANMMDEVRHQHQVLAPVETLFVVDAMAGQDAATTARAFSDILPLTGVILSKADSDSRGGAALSVRQVTGVPIKFMGTGEKTDALEPFYPERLASRILGMGDMMSLIEEAERKLDRTTSERLAGKLQRGQGFNLADFRVQLQQMKQMGGMAAMMEKLPGVGAMSGMAQQLPQQGMFDRMEVIIDSMTRQEQHFPDIINGSRKRRIALGCGMQIQDVNRLLKQHKLMQRTMKKMTGKGGLKRLQRNLQGGLSFGRGKRTGGKRSRGKRR